MNLKNLFRSVLITAFLVLTTSMLSFAQIYVNNTNGDDLNGAGSQLSPYKSISKALTVASAGATINIAADTYAEGNVLIDKAVTLVATPFSGSTTVNIPNGVTINTASASDNVNIGVTGEKFNLGTTNAALVLTKGNLHITSANVIIGGGARITRSAGTLDNSPTVTNVDVLYTSTDNVTAGGEIPANIGSGVLTINVTAGKTVTFTNAITTTGGVQITTGNAVFGSLNLSSSSLVNSPAGNTVTVSDISFTSGVITNVSTGAVTVSGSVSWTVNGNLGNAINNAGNGNVTINGAVNFAKFTGTGAGASDHTASILNSGTGNVTLAQGFSVTAGSVSSTSYTINVSATNSAGGNLVFGGTVALVDLTNTAAGSISLAGGTVSGTVANNAGGKVELTANTTFSGTTIGNGNAGSVIKLNSNILTISNNAAVVTNTGKIISVTAATVGAGIVSVTGTGVAINGGELPNVTIASGKGLTTTSTNVYGSVTNGGTLNIDVAIQVEGDLTNSGAVDLDANLTLKGSYTQTAGTLDMGSATFEVYGNWLRSSNVPLDVTFGTSVLSFRGGNAQTFTPGASLKLYDVIVNKSAGVVTLTQSLEVARNYTITAGGVNLGDYNIRMVGATGTFANGGNFYSTTGNGYLIFEGTGAAYSISAGVNGVFSNMDIRSGSTVTVASNINFSGKLILRNGTLAVGANTFTFSNDLVAIPSITRHTATGSMTQVGGTITREAGVVYDLTYIGDADATAAAEWLGSGLNNLTIATGDGAANPSNRTVTGPGGANTISGALSVNLDQTLDLGAGTLTFASDAIAHTVVGNVVNGTIIVTGDNVVLNGSTLAAATATVNNLQASTAAAETFTANNLKVISGNLTVDNGTVNVTMNSTDGTITGNVLLTAGTMNLTVASGTTNVMSGNVTVVAGTMTLTRGNAVARQIISGNVVLTGGTLALGSDVKVNGTTTLAAGNLALNSFNYIQAGSVATPDFNRTGVGAITGTGKLVLDGTSAAVSLTPGTTLSIPNLELVGDVNGVTLTAALTVSNSLTHTSGAASINTLTLSGNTYTFTAGSYAAGTLVFTGAAVTGTFTASVTIPNVTVNSTGALTIASNNTTAKTITVSGVLTQTAGNIDLGINSLVLTGGAGAYVRAAGNMTMGSGRLILNGAGLTFDPGTDFSVDNLTVSANASNSTANTWTVAKSLILAAPLTVSTPAANDKLIMGAGATIERQAVGATLSHRPVFGTSINLVYSGVGGPWAVGVEVPAANIINNITVSTVGGVTLGNSQAITVNGKLTLATLLDAMTANPDATVTMADGSTLELQALGTTVLDKDLVRAGILNIIYNGAPTTSTRELGLTTNATTHTAGNVTVKSSVALDAAATFTGTVTFDGASLNLAGFDLYIQGDIVETTNATAGFFTAGAASNLYFSGNTNQTITLNTNKAINANLNITIQKASGANTITLAKGNLDFDANNKNITFVNGVVVTGDNTIRLNVPGGSAQGFDRSGVTGTNVSHIVGNVVKAIPAGTGRYTFPVGSLAEYRPSSIVFSTAPIYGFDMTVNHVAASPEGFGNLPILNGIAEGRNIGKYPNFYWLIKSDVPLGTDTRFNLELTGNGFTEFSQVSDLRVIRRVDGAASVNPWWLQGGNYDNFLIGSNPTVANLNSTGGITPAGARFTYGLEGSFGFTVSGTVKYGNLSGTKLPNVSVSINTNPVKTTTTDANGAFSFAEVPAGSYKVTTSSTANWLRANASDALLVAKHFAGTIPTPLSEIGLLAADVNKSNSITANDALLILKRSTNSSVVFAAGNWVFTSPSVTVTTANVTNVAVKGLTTGDVNGSNTPSLEKAAPTVTVTEGESVKLNKANVINIPVKVTADMSVGAMNLVFNYPADLVSFEGISSKANEIYNYDNQNGKVALAWADLSGKDAIDLKAGEAIVTLQFKSKKELKAGSVVNIELDGAASEIANKLGEVVNASLSVVNAEVAKPTEFALRNNYPNPFNPATTIRYEIPVNGIVNLVVFNSLGEQVATLVNGAQEVGQYEVNFNASNLTSGVYFYRLTVNAGEQNFTQTHKMILMK